MLILSVFEKCWKLWRFLLKKYQDHVPGSFVYKRICVDDEFTKPVVLFRDEISAYKLIEAILKEFEYCKKVIKKHFSKNLVMSEKVEEQFQSHNICWIYEKKKKKKMVMTMKK